MKARELTSATNPRLKLIRKLQDRRQRDEAGLFVIEGPHVLGSAIAAGVRLKEVFCTAAFAGRHAALAQQLEAAEWPVWRVSEELVNGLATTEHSQGVVAVAESFRAPAEPEVEPGLLVLALEGVGDPGNVGSAIRAAHAAGASMVVLGPGCCDRFNAKAVRASAGGLFAVPTLESEDLVALLSRLRREGARVVVAEPRAERLCWEADLTPPTVLLVGSEARGLSAPVREQADERVAIPMPGGAESLNAASAAAVLLYEAVRQRRSGVRRGQ